MAISLKHAFTSAIADSGDTSLVQPSNWNAEHNLTMATSRILGRTTAGTGAAEEISVGTGLSLSAGSLAVSTIPVANGGTGATASPDAINNLTGFLNITSAAGTTALTSSSPQNIYVSGSTTQIIQLPDVTTLALGWAFQIQNGSTGAVTVQSSGGNSFNATIQSGHANRFVCIAVTGTTTSSWQVTYYGSTSRTGSGNQVYASSPTLTTPTITTSAVIPLVNGGTTSSSTLTLQSTSGAGTTDAIIFNTGSQSEKFRIGTAGQLGIGGANYGASGQVLTSGGASAAPSWTTPSASAAQGIFWENDQTVTTNYTVTAGKNAGTFGPVTINSGVTVTVPSNSTWTIV